MRRVGIHGAGFVPVGAMGACPSAAAAAPWYLSGGILAANCLAAYTPKGAANLAASYDNNAAPGNGLPDGTYDCTLGVVPGWAAGTGWVFDGIAQYLDTNCPNGWPVVGTWSVLIQFADTVGTGNLTPIGADNLKIQPARWGSAASANGGGVTGFAPELPTGNYGFAGLTAYRDGLADGVLGGGALAPEDFYIGCTRSGGLPGQFYPGKVWAAAIYNVTITAAQALAVATAMAAL